MTVGTGDSGGAAAAGTAARCPNARPGPAPLPLRQEPSRPQVPAGQRTTMADAGGNDGEAVSVGAAMAAAGPPTPWPADHEPRTRGERRLWLSFAALRADPAGPLDVKLVATRIGMSRTSIAYDGCAHGALRTAVLTEIDRRVAAQAEKAAATVGASPTGEAPVRGVRYWQAIAQRADSRIGEFKAMAVRERYVSRRTRALLRRVLDDMKAGRWTRVDEDAVMIADIAAELHVAERRAAAEE